MLVLLGWIAVALIAALLATQAASWSGTRTIVMAQALHPFFVAISLPIAIIAFVAGNWWVGVAAATVTAGVGGFAWAVLRATPATPPRPGAHPLRVFHSNLLYLNERPAEVPSAVLALDPDVVAFTEYTTDHSTLLAASALADRYPHRIEHADGERTGGSAIWSRFPLIEVESLPSRDVSTAAVVGAPDPVVVHVVHPPSPLASLAAWHDELARLGPLITRDPGPVVVVGDFNADVWHPPFRRLLATGWRDAHVLLRRALSNSWPTDRPPVPPFVRLDHALVNDALTVIDVIDIDVPGSDHRGLVVTVALAGDDEYAPGDA